MSLRLLLLGLVIFFVAFVGFQANRNACVWQSDFVDLAGCLMRWEP